MILKLGMVQRDMIRGYGSGGRISPSNTDVAVDSEFRLLPLDHHWSSSQCQSISVQGYGLRNQAKLKPYE